MFAAHASGSCQEVLWQNGLARTVAKLHHKYIAVSVLPVKNKDLDPKVASDPCLTR